MVISQQFRTAQHEGGKTLQSLPRNCGIAEKSGFRNGVGRCVGSPQIDASFDLACDFGIE